MIKKFPLLLLLAIELFCGKALFGADRNKYLIGHPPSPMHLDDSDNDDSDEKISELPIFQESRNGDLDPELTQASTRLTLSSSAEYERGSSSTLDGRSSAGPHSLFSPKKPTVKPPSALCISPQLGIIRPYSFKRQSSISDTPMKTAEDGAAAAAADARPETPIPSFSQEPPKGIYSPRKNKRARSASPNETQQEAGSPTKKRRFLKDLEAGSSLMDTQADTGSDDVPNAPGSDQAADDNLMNTDADSSSDDDDL